MKFSVETKLSLKGMWVAIVTRNSTDVNNYSAIIYVVVNYIIIKYIYVNPGNKILIGIGNNCHCNIIS